MRAIHLLPWLTLLILATKSVYSQLTNSSACLNRCGSVNISYPFGTGPGCYYDESFLVTCNATTDKLFFPTSNVSILDILIISGELRVEGPIAKNCYNYDLISRSVMMTNSNFPLSTTRNKLTTVGCNSLGYMRSLVGQENMMAVCASMCNKINDVVNGSCFGGIGCCQMSILANVTDFTLFVRGLDIQKNVQELRRCGYSFVVEDGAYEFSSAHVNDLQNKTVPLILDWAIGKSGCEEAQQNDGVGAVYACRDSNSFCLNSTNGLGYRCSCSHGYQGNPYLVNGCIDINECDESTNPCVGSCTNLSGNFSCSCPKGYEGDGTKNGTGCYPLPNRNQSVLKMSIALGGAMGFGLLTMAAWCLHNVLRKRKIVKRKEKYFKRNGGLLLQQQMSTANKVNVEQTKIFTSKELKTATDNFNVNRILGQGGQGTVFKGMLSDGKIVAVKMSKQLDEGKSTEFINEIVILSQINHRNVVKVLGCCLETEVPLLVYEYISNGTLAQYIHGKNDEFIFTWKIRLRVATEIASALSYLHSSTSSPIYHRDIKSVNILMDEKYRAKIADFGTSKSVNIDQTHVTTQVQGTFGYLDPEYFQTSQFTDKSDVYSFGVLLVELLTGQKAISTTRMQQGRSLATHFITSMQQNQVFDILDANVLEGPRDEILVVANIAKRCLNLNSRKRPSMKDVTVELEGIELSKRASEQTQIQHCDEFEYVRTHEIEPWDVVSTSTELSTNNKSCDRDELPLLSITST